jgi:hypothetical protein
MGMLSTRQFVPRVLLALRLAAYMVLGSLALDSLIVQGQPAAASNLSPSSSAPEKPRPAIAPVPAGPGAAAASASRGVALPSRALASGSLRTRASRLRDPFREPEDATREVPAGAPRPVKPRPPGIGGLLLDQVRLQGIVREEVTGQMIAMVATQTNLSYFVHVNDQLYDGVVSRITPDAVYIRRTGFALRGDSGEVVLRLAPATGGQQ